MDESSSGTTSDSSYPPLNRTIDAIFDDMAPGYDRLRFIQNAADRLVELADIRPGMTILDTATGTGRAALDEACAVAPDGVVVGIDLSKGMLTRARSNIQAENCTAALSLALVQGDALRLPFPAAAFDRVVCASGLFFMPDMTAALVAWRHALKTGGLVAFCAFARGIRQPMTDLLEKRMAAFGLKPQGHPGLRDLSRLENCLNLLQAAGFERVESRTEQLGYYLPFVEDYWEEELYGLHRTMISQLTPEERETLRQEHLTEVRPLVTGQGLWIDVPVNLVVGRKT